MDVDIFEPEDIGNYILQSSPQSNLGVPLNSYGWADYRWVDWMDCYEQAERKQCGEILGGMEEVEDQIRREVQAHPECRLWLLVEGLAYPGVKVEVGRTVQGTWVFKRVGGVWKPTWFYGVRFELYEGFLTGLRRQGVLVRETRDSLTTAKVLVQLEQSAKHEPTTLQRHLKPKLDWIPDPQVMTLMGGYKSGVGPILAERLVGRKGVFSTVWDLLQASPEFIAECVEGVGVETAKKLQRSFGKDV